MLCEAAQSVGGPQIRNIATIGGNICNGVTSADSASSLFALNAMVLIKSKNGTRQIPISEFYLGPGKVDLKKADNVTLNIDHRVSGVGGSSFMYNFKEEFLLKDSNYSYSFWIKPIESHSLK